MDPDQQGYCQVREVEIEETGSIVHLVGFGAIELFRGVAKDGDIEHWANYDLAMDELRRLSLAELGWVEEDYRRILKQTCNVEQYQVRSSRSQKNPIGLSNQALVRLTWAFD